MNTSNITNYKPKDFAKLLGVSVQTLQRWDRDGILKAYRTPTDRLNGLRKYKSRIKGDEEIAEELQNTTQSNTGTGAED